MSDLLPSDLIAKIDRQRMLRGFMTLAEMLDWLLSQENIVLDPFSTLISKNVNIGRGNVFYPQVTIEANDGGSISIGNGNTFASGSVLLAEQGRIDIGDDNQFGDGGIRIKANLPEALIQIGSNGRYMNGAEIMGRCRLGSGSQIIGNITVQNCDLGDGDSYKDPNPETRAGLLKGFGLARNLQVRRGEVISGQGSFDQAQIEQQAAYHPKKT